MTEVPDNPHLIDAWEYKRREANIQRLGYRTWQEYIDGPRWQEIRREVLKVKGKRCFLCGRSGDEIKIELHHDSYDMASLRGDITYIYVLCEDCHKDIERLPNGEKRTNMQDVHKHLWHKRESYLLWLEEEEREHKAATDRWLAQMDTCDHCGARMPDGECYRCPPAEIRAEHEQETKMTEEQQANTKKRRVLSRQHERLVWDYLRDEVDTTKLTLDEIQAELQNYLDHNEYPTTISRSTVERLMNDAGLPWKSARPVPQGGGLKGRVTELEKRVTELTEDQAQLRQTVKAWVEKLPHPRITASPPARRPEHQREMDVDWDAEKSS